MDTIPGNSYGDNYSGAKDFDFVEFVKRPRTICRVISIVFAIVVFGCIAAAGYDSGNHQCNFNDNDDACHYGVAIGVLAFLACLLFLAVDVQFSSISNAKTRKQLVLADLGFSGIWAFLWFVGFCFLADQWRRSNIKSQNETNHARAAIAFSFFSIFTWVALTLMGYQSYRQGDGFHDDDSPSAHGEYQGGYSSASDFSKSPYASFPQPSEDNSVTSYQQPHQQPHQQPFGVVEQPFGVPPPQQRLPAQPPVVTEYNVPEY